MRTTGRRLGVATLMVAGAVSAAGSPSRADIAGVVRVEQSRFTPREVDGVRPGDTVYWGVPKPQNNEPPEPTHTLTSVDGTFPEQTLEPGKVVGLQFNQPGHYAYYCTFHGAPDGTGMAGVVHVVAAEPPPPASSTTTTTAPPPPPPASSTTTTTAPPPPPPASSTTTTTAPAPPPSTTPTTAPPTTPTTSAPSPSPAPAPTTTTAAKKAPDGTTSTTSAKAKAKAKAEAAGVATTTTVPAPVAAAPVADSSTTTVTEAPTTTTTTPVEVREPDAAALAAVADDERGPRKGSGPVKAIGAGAGGLLLTLGGWAWYHRSSRYLPA